MDAAIAVTLSLLLSGVAQGVPAETKKPVFEPVEIVVRPAGEPVPALRYRLAFERRELVPGNAAIFYHRAIQQLELVRKAQPKPAAGAESNEKSLDAAIADWASEPIETLDLEGARKVLEAYQAVLHEIELGAQRRECDWEFDERTEGLNLLLSEIQEMRSLARLVAVVARVAILEGKTDEALRWIRIGMTMGRHVAHGPTLIQALVGVAIDSVMVRCLTDLIQQPKTPSLYWALADRPRPMIDMRYPMEGERYLLEKELPELSELERGVWSLERAQSFAQTLVKKLSSFSGGGPPTPSGPMQEWVKRLGIGAMAAKIYPAAKEALIDEGMPAADVEAMPVIQVATLYTLREYTKARDNVYKWMNVPYPQSGEALQKQQDLGSVQRKLDNPLLTLFQLLTPALNAARYASVRLERNLDALQVIEGIRLQMAERGARFPESIETNTVVPMPLDPATGKPFGYKPDPRGVQLSGPLPPGIPAHASYVIGYLLKYPQ